MASDENNSLLKHLYEMVWELTCHILRTVERVVLTCFVAELRQIAEALSNMSHDNRSRDR